MGNTFRHIKYDDVARAQAAAFKAKFEELEAMILKLVPGRESALAATNMEQAHMWIGKAIRNDQFKRDATFERETEDEDAPKQQCPVLESLPPCPEGPDSEPKDINDDVSCKAPAKKKAAKKKAK